MLKVLIVDDNAYARTELKTMIDWESNGFFIAGEANNGMNAIQIMEKEDPDLVITDMNMPVMNGVDLIDYIEKNHPHVGVVALSAYDDFEYVRQSMKKGAIDYVLKHHLSAPVLLEMLKAAANSILKHRDENERMNEMSAELSLSKGALRQAFIRKLLAGSLTDREEIVKQFESLDIALDTEHLVVTAVEIDDFPFLEDKYTPGEVDGFIQTFMDISTEILQDWERSMIVHLGRGKFSIIFSLGRVHSQLYEYNRQFTILNRIRMEVKKYLNVTASFGVSKPRRDIMQLHRASLEAERLLRDKFFKGKNGIFIENTGEHQEEAVFSLDIQAEKEIYAALRNLEEERVFQRLEEVFDKIQNARMGAKSTHMICAELIHIAGKVCKDTGIEISALYNSQDIPYTMIQKYETLMDIKAWVLGLYRKLIELQKQMGLDHSLSKVTRKAVTFIHNHYSKNISLTEVADAVGVSASYISRLIKEECGIGFTEYLNQIRVDQAKLLIVNGDMKLKDIVRQVGFNNYNYFFRVFKDLTGMTPLEFEQQAKSYSGV